MARKIKRFFVFLFFSLIFSMLSGRFGAPVTSKGKQIKSGIGINTALAGACCAKICGESPNRYCC